MLKALAAALAFSLGPNTPQTPVVPPPLQETVKYSVQYAHHQEMGGRVYQQDRLTFVQQPPIAIVCDGHGPHDYAKKIYSSPTTPSPKDNPLVQSYENIDGGATVALFITKTLCAKLKNLEKTCGQEPSPEEMQKYVELIFAETNTELDEYWQKQVHPKFLYQWSSQAGTTGSAVFLYKNWLVCAHVGDSKILCFNKENQLLYESVDHHPETPSEKQRLMNSKQYDYVKNNRINGILTTSRSFGCQELRDFGLLCKPVVQILDAQKVHMAIICSDGVIDEQFPQEKLTEFTQNHQTHASDNAQKLVNFATNLNEKTNRTAYVDNKSAIIMYITPK